MHASRNTKNLSRFWCAAITIVAVHVPWRVCSGFAASCRSVTKYSRSTLKDSRYSFSSSTTRTRTNMHVVVIGGGIQGAAVAYFLAEKHGDQQQQKQQSAQPTSTTPNTTTLRITVLEAVAPAAAASGKGGGFMGRSWGGDGSPTQRLHELSFDLYDQLASKHASSITSYRKLPVLSVAPSSSNTKNNLLDQAQQDQTLKSILPSWLDGSVGRIRVMGHGDDTAQVTPVEVVHTMLSAHPDIVSTVLGRCVGIESAALPPMAPDTPPGHRQVTGVRYVPTTSQESAVPNGHDDPEAPEILLPADVVVVCAGPWSCMAETWFGTSESPLELPMEGIKSTSIVWKSPSNDNGETQGGAVDPTALFCGEDGRYGTHLEVYPRPDGTIYICGIGGSDYISKDSLKNGMHLTDCNPNDARVKAAVASFGVMSSTYAANGVLDRTQACMRPCPPDAMPYMGRIPGYEGAYINAGHNCWGIAWAPACGVAMAELILEGESTSVDLTPFDPTRYTPKATAGRRGRKKQGVDVGEQW